MSDFYCFHLFSGCSKMACHDDENLRCMIDTCFNDKLFSRSLKDPTFSSFLEVLKNSKKKKFKHCFSKKSRRGLTRHKNLVKFLLNSSVSLKRRKKKFRKSSKKFKKLIHDHLIPEFLKNCVECENQ